MPAFLTPEWVEAANAAMAGTTATSVPGTSPRAGPQGTFSVCQLVRGGPRGDVATTLRVEGASVRMELGEDPAATVTVSMAWDDALQMARGTLSPAAALAAGKIRVRGDLGVLAASQEVLAGALARRRTLRQATGTPTPAR